MKLLVSVSLACMLVGFCFVAATKWQPNMKTFSHAIKAAYCHKGQEIELFRHDSGPGMITEQWFTGGQCFGPNTIVRYFIDGDKKPTIEMNLYVGHGIGFVSSSDGFNQSSEDMDKFKLKERFQKSKDQESNRQFHEGLGGDSTVPWGTRRIGHLAKGGGLYNTIRMPFQKSIRITFTSTVDQGYYWYIIRGSENYPLIIGDLELPKTAKLKLYKLEDLTIFPLQYVTMASSSNSSGLLYQVTLAGSSVNFHYLEACFRARVDDEDNLQYLSSGTEDFFLSAYYYNGGQFHTSHSGLTYFKNPGTMSAYKFFEDDPVMFTKSFKLLWRCGEANDNNCFKLSNRDCFQQGDETYCKNPKGVHERLKNLDLATAKITSYVWTYEWPN